MSDNTSVSISSSTVPVSVTFPEYAMCATLKRECVMYMHNVRREEESGVR
jgi:hypothetical protein